jgi:hypothetical protein
MDKKVVVFGLFSVTVLTGTVIACTSTVTSVLPDPNSVDGGDGGKKEGGGGGGNDSGGGGNPDDLCGEEATKQACGECCITNHPTGYKTFETALLECVCDGTGSTQDAGAGNGPCKTQCATTICAAAPMNPNAACNTCINGSIQQNGACLQHVGTQCQADQDCVDQQTCVGQCQSKP